jgi:hypothetical protein
MTIAPVQKTISWFLTFLDKRWQDHEQDEQALGRGQQVLFHRWGLCLAHPPLSRLGIAAAEDWCIDVVDGIFTGVP